ncbi:hypothetical protein [Haloglomus salinum]|jgi:hypothetical protein|uniref:hypothetical protein n=1 Tax=Haloglomus salinum TaxID=2962673 RepID=UPI0020C9969C|nr:hypothetical protein [Haloglomus salinum]
MSDSETPDLDELEAKHERNRQQRLAFVKRWAEYVRTHPDEEWARQQKVVIDGQVDPPPDERETDAADDGEP